MKPPPPVSRPTVQRAIPAIFELLFRPSRYKVMEGGRGSAKSWTVASVLIGIAHTRKVRILCARELQNSIEDSVHKLLSDHIDSLGLAAHFKVTRSSIVSLLTGSEFMFKGLRHNILDIKSTEGIDICWVEEAHHVSEISWETLIPTIRKPDSEIWITFNADSVNDPTYVRFVTNKALLGDDIQHVLVNYIDNPFFPEVLRKEMEYMRKTDFDAYEHVWLGKPKGRSKALVLHGKWRVDVFASLPEDRFYFGADWGFAQDPSVLIRCFIRERTLFIDHESWGIGVELDELPQLFNAVPGVKTGLIKADNSRPETISHMSARHFAIRPAKKWAGSVEDGVTFLRSFESIVIHPRCKRTIEEAGLYSYKVDRVTGEVLPIILDKFNHCMDAIRYALDGLINRGGGVGMLDFAAQELAARRAEKEAADKAAAAQQH